MLPLIKPLAVELGGLQGKNTPSGPDSDQQPGAFAGLLNRSAAKTEPSPTSLLADAVSGSADFLELSGAETEPPPASLLGGLDLPQDGKILPIKLTDKGFPGLQAELSVPGFLDQGLMPSTSMQVDPLNLNPDQGLAVDGKNVELQSPEIGIEKSSKSLQALLQLGEPGGSKPGELSPHKITEWVSRSGSSVTGSSLGLVSEQQLRQLSTSRRITEKASLVQAETAGRLASRTEFDPRAIGLRQIPALTPVEAVPPKASGERLVPPAPIPNQGTAVDPSNTTAEYSETLLARLTTGPASQAAPASVGAQAVGAQAVDASALSTTVPNASAPASTTASTISTGQAGSTPSLQIATPMQDAAWSNALGERVVLMSGQQLKSAEIRISPAELGPIRVNLSVDDGAAELTFVAQHALTRDAIEQALPRLREMLTENGLSLGSATVSEDGVPEDRYGRDGRDSDRSPSMSDRTDGAEASDEQVTQRVTQGLIDTFV